MTSTTSGKGFIVFDNTKNQEWLRRRRLRLEQVRRQSNEIAKTLRERIISDEKARKDEFDKMSEARFKNWKAEKLDELEKKLRWALEEFGQSYRLAEEEPDPEEVIEEGNKTNWAKAQKRGEIAVQEELRMKKIAEEKKMSPILRKQLTRKKEDLRSALLRSVPLKKQLSEIQVTHAEKAQSEKVSEKKVSKRKVSTNKSCKCRHKRASKPSDNKMWINLNELQLSSAGESGLEEKTNKSSKTFEKNQKDRHEGTVEFYDFSSNYHCKSFKEFPHLVERIESKAEMPNANQLAQLEDEKEKIDVKKRLEADAISQERGLEALRREKIRREYYKLIAQLEKLNKKEKVLKAQQRNLPNFLHMTDERLSERERTKQRIMDTRFESIYYAALEQIPQMPSPMPDFTLYQGGGDYIESDERLSTKLSFSSSNLKLNTPVTSEIEDSVESTSDDTIRRKKKTRKKKQLLVDIDNALRKGRELRKTVYESRGSEEEEEIVEKKLTSDIVTQTDPVDESPKEDERKMTKSQESQTEEPQVDDSIPTSSATSYKSPPSVIKSSRLQDFLDYLEGISETEDMNHVRSNSKVNGLLRDLLPSNSKEKEDKSFSPTLEYYIEKLLNMSRECIANLSISSENFSTPNVTDLDVKEAKTYEAEYLVEEAEESDRKSKLKRADQFAESIKNWKDKLEKKSEKFHYEHEDVPDGATRESSEEDDEGDDGDDDDDDDDDDDQEEESVEEANVIAIRHPEIQSRYEEITKKCSERISELSNMLERVRREKEKLLSSASDGSCLSLTKEKEKPKDEEVEEEEYEDVRPRPENPLASLVFEEYSNGQALLSRFVNILLQVNGGNREDAVRTAQKALLYFRSQRTDKVKQSSQTEQRTNFNRADPAQRTQCYNEFLRICLQQRNKENAEAGGSNKNIYEAWGFGNGPEDMEMDPQEWVDYVNKEHQAAMEALLAMLPWGDEQTTDPPSECD